MFFALSLSPCAPLRRLSGGAIAPPGVQAFISGGLGGVASPSQPLTGIVTGGAPPLVIEPGWMADGSPIAGATSDTFTPEPGVNVPPEAEIQYAPTVNGQVYLSALMRLAPVVTVSVTGDFDGNALPGIELAGVIAGGLPDQFILHRWQADGTEIAGAVRAEFTPTASLPVGTVLRYAPIIEGLTFLSEDIVLASAVTVSLSGGTSGEVLPGQMLTGEIMGGFAAQVVDHRWSADGSLISGETDSVFAPQPGVNVSAGAQIRYAPLISGLSYQSDPVTLVEAVAVSVTGAPGGVAVSGAALTGVVTGGFSGQVVLHRWRANGTLIAGETSATLIPVAGENVPAGAELRYAPEIDGQTYLSAAISLTDNLGWVFENIAPQSVQVASQPVAPAGFVVNQISSNSAFFGGI